MASFQYSNPLEEAVDGGHGGGAMILLKDCVENSGRFIIHQLLKRALLPQSSDVVVFLAFAQPFSHYDRILRKMGCNFSVQRDKRRLLFIDIFSDDTLDKGNRGTGDEMIIELYGKVHRAVEDCGSHVMVIIDDVSLMELHGNSSPSLVFDFLKYCCSLTVQFGCSVVALIHSDVYSKEDHPFLLLQLEYLADVVINVEPLATGLATDVHGQLTVTRKRVGDDFSESRNRVQNLHFRIKDTSIDYFYPGSKN